MAESKVGQNPKMKENFKWKTSGGHRQASITVVEIPQQITVIHHILIPLFIIHGADSSVSWTPPAGTAPLEMMMISPTALTN